MKKLFALIALFICTPNTHTAAALEDLPISKQVHEIPTYINQARAAQLRKESPPPSSKTPYFFTQEDIKHSFADRAATVIESPSIPNLEKIGDLYLLDKAYWKDRKAIVEHMIQHGADVNDIVYEKFRSNRGSAPLCTSIEFDDIEFARYLVRRGADVNRYTNATPLMIVVRNMVLVYPFMSPLHFKLLELLIVAGADADFIPPNKNNVSIRQSIAHHYEIKEAIKKAEKEKKEKKEIESFLFIIKNITPVLNTILFDYLPEEYASLMQKVNF